MSRSVRIGYYKEYKGVVPGTCNDLGFLLPEIPVDAFKLNLQSKKESRK